MINSIQLPEGKLVSVGDMIRTPDAGEYEGEVLKAGKWYRIVELSPPLLVRIIAEDGRTISTVLELQSSWLPPGVKWEISTYEENLKKILD